MTEEFWPISSFTTLLLTIFIDLQSSILRPSNQSLRSCGPSEPKSPAMGLRSTSAINALFTIDYLARAELIRNGLGVLKHCHFLEDFDKIMRHPIFYDQSLEAEQPLLLFATTWGWWCHGLRLNYLLNPIMMLGQQMSLQLEENPNLGSTAPPAFTGDGGALQKWLLLIWWFP